MSGEAREESSSSHATSWQTMNKKELGNKGEELACLYLQEQGVELLERNWRCRTGEIDIIARDGERIVFVEVRTRLRSGKFGTAVESVTPRKQQQVRETATVYLHQHRLSDSLLRFDVIAIQLNNGESPAQISHIAGAF